MKYGSSLLIFIAFALYSALLHAEGKYAVVIGNSAYVVADKLKNPVNDARLMADTLDELNFDVTLITNATKLDIEQAVDKLILNLKEDRGAVMFYYAGHGVQLEGNNYLLPVDADVREEIEVAHKGYNVSHLLDRLKVINNKTNIILLDACRDNPFAGIAKANSRSAASGVRALKLKSAPKLSSGLSKLDAPSNTLIAYATAPGKVAYDGNGKNSHYTTALVESMMIEGLTAEQVFKNVRGKIIKETNGEQIPWESSSLVYDLYFKPRKTLPTGW